MEFKENKDSKFQETLNIEKNKKRLGIHSFHRYYGKLIPAIPSVAINLFTGKGDLVFDPFVGSGTTAVESIYADRNFLGLEINPLSVQISKVKVENYDINTLEDVIVNILDLIRKDTGIIDDEERPFCINREHWFKDFVQDDLIVIHRNIPKAVSFIKNKNEKEKYENFLMCVLSAIVKQVSNADTMHVFPGISIRMKKLEAEGKIKINVFETYERALKKRTSYVAEFGTHTSSAKIILCDSSNADLSDYKDSVDLIVTNPPYISSIRYAETLKLELYWMGICKTSEDYSNLSNSMIGNDHLSKQECKDKYLTKYDFINSYIEMLYQIDKKQAKVLYLFFTRMEKVILLENYVLKKGKKLVMKISDSKIRKIKIPTGEVLTKIAELNGFRLVDYFNDKINQNSRSLTTARNTYSDIILEDNIIIWEKV